MAGGGSVGDEAGDDVGVFERDGVGVELFDEPGENEFGSAGCAASWEVYAKAEGFFEFVGGADGQGDSGQVSVVASIIGAHDQTPPQPLRRPTTERRDPHRRSHPSALRRTNQDLCQRPPRRR